MTKRITLKDVAIKAGVSYQTVSKVVNGRVHVSPETETRIWGAVEALGYKPNRNARNLRVQRAHMIGYSWVPEQPDRSPVLDLFFTSMVEEAEAVGYHLLPFPYRGAEGQITAYREMIDTGQVDGFVLSSVSYRDPRIDFLLGRQFPFVAFGREPERDFPCVDVDGSAGLQMATEHLIARGHRRIAALGGPENSRVSDDRLSGYFKALRLAGIPIDESLIAHHEETFEFGQLATEQWLAWEDQHRPTGIVTTNDSLAAGAVRAGQSRGLVIGRDLAIIGFDDTPMAQYLWPPLTTIRQPIRAIGQKCIEMLVTLLEGKTLTERQVLFQPELIVRASA